MRGRESETTLIEEMLHRGRTGTGGVLLVEGEPGMGKTLLLAEAAKAATTRGYTTVAAAADEFERMIPLRPLVRALGDAPVPAAEDSGSDLNTDPPMEAVARVRRSLERLAGHGPVLVTADDLQYADPVTLLALRVLPRELAARPLSWVLARSTRPDSGAAQLFDVLGHEGACRVLLTPLSDAAVVAVTEDLLGCVPSPSLLSLARDTGGNPLLLAELLRGLREENTLRTWAAGTAGTAGAAGATAESERLPDRIRRYFQHQTGNLRPGTRQLIEVSAVLGQSFAVEDVAEMLGQPPATALLAISDALAAGILVPAGEALAFRDGMTWRAVAQSLPDAVSRALHHQAGRLFLERGDAARAAGHLIRAARQGDSRVLGELDQALPRLLPNDARTAAGVASRALELTSADDPARADRALSAVRALLAARRLRDAAGLVETSLASPLRAASRARLRCARLSVLTLSGLPAQARAEAEDLLAEPDLPASVRDDATVTLLDALADLPDLAAAEQRARGIARRAASTRGADRPAAIVVAAARALQATVMWNQGHIAAGLDLFREAEAAAASAAASHAAPEASAEPAPGRRLRLRLHRLTLAARLIDVGLAGEALALIDAPPADDEDAAGIAISQAGPDLLRARIHLAAGRVEAARAAAGAALGPEREATADGFPQAMLARCTLGTIALRAGDLNSAGQVLDWTAPRLADAGDGRVGVLCHILAAQVADARDGPAAAMRIAGGVYDLIGEVRWPLIRDPSTAPWLARLALAVGDGRRAARLGAVAAELGRLNPDFPTVTASCAHAQGLLKNDIGALTLAARTQPDAWASAGAAADLAALLADSGRVAEAIEWLDRAHGDFLTAGATRDAARVRGMLRGLGVRRRTRTQARRGAIAQPAGTGGLGALSAAERGIAELVCQGLTNRQIADLAFVSPNTVAFHLRNIYRKLGLASRLQLARLVLDTQHSQSPQQPPQQSPQPESADHRQATRQPR